MTFEVRFIIGGIEHPHRAYVFARSKRASEEKMARWIQGDCVFVELQPGVLARLPSSLIDTYEVTLYNIFATSAAMYTAAAADDRACEIDQL